MTTEEIKQLPITNQLATIANDAHLAPALVGQITEVFSPLYAQAEQVLDEAALCKVTDPTDLRGMKKAGDLRKTLKHIRTTAEKSRVAMTADALKVKSTIDLVARTLRLELEAAEDYLESQEKLAERMQAEREAKIKAERSQQLAYLNVNPDLYNLAVMPEADWQKLLKHAEDDFNAAQEAAYKAEQDRLAKQEADRIVRERLEQENERLRKEQAEKDRAAAEERRKAQAEQQRLQREKDEAEAKAHRESEALKAKMLQEHQARQEHERKLAAQQRAEADRIAKEAADKAAAAKKAADAAAAKAKAAADAKLAAEAAKRKQAESAAGELLAAVGLVIENADDEAEEDVVVIRLSTSDFALIRACYRKGGGQ